MATRIPLHPNVRRSPYFARTLAAGAVDFMVYNHTYMPLDYGRDAREDYDALVERVTLWDVGAERQTELRGPDALELADYLSPRDLSGMAVGDCKFSPVCDDAGEIMGECIVLRPWEDVVWFSHSSVDLTLWAIGHGRWLGLDAVASEPDVAPLQLQGPAAGAVLEAVSPGIRELARYRCAQVQVAGVDSVVSNTGWSREAGYEIYPLSSERAEHLWDALVEAGEPHGLLVTGPIIIRAVEQAISDTQYVTNSHVNPIEAGMGGMIDLDGAPFAGRDALRAVRDAGPARRTIGLVCDGPPFDRMEEFWPLVVGDAEVGVVRWAVHSFALEQNIAIALVDAATGDDAAFVVRAPDGDRAARVHELPFV
jgi:aminomethyltransferase